MHGVIKYFAFVCVCVCVRACVCDSLRACTCDKCILVYANLYLFKNTRINNCQGNELVIFSMAVSFSTVTSYRLNGWYSSFRNSKIFIFTAIFTYPLIQNQLLFNVGLKWPARDAKCLSRFFILEPTPSHVQWMSQDISPEKKWTESHIEWFSVNCVSEAWCLRMVQFTLSVLVSWPSLQEVIKEVTWCSLSAVLSSFTFSIILRSALDSISMTFPSGLTCV